MAIAKLNDAQLFAIEKMRNGSVCCGGVGSGKSRTAIGYFYKISGGDLSKNTYKKISNISDLYIITTAKKRDSKEWTEELLLYGMHPDTDRCYQKNKVVIDSWNNIKKYVGVVDAFFIFDEQRLVGHGSWAKSFQRIANKNSWILLSATPGDTWGDYIQVFIANGFFKNKTQFDREHVVWTRGCTFPKIDRYVNTGRLMRLRDRLLVDIPSIKVTKRHDEDIWCNYDRGFYRDIIKTRWNPFKDQPIENAAELCYVWRKIVNSDQSRQTAMLELFEKHPKMIVFYNFDYELEILRTIFDIKGLDVAELNGHKHQEVPKSNTWIYLVQYTAGAEAWNCITTDTIVFYSQNYSYKILEQSKGRIDRLNTRFVDLYYYHLKSRSPIDMAISRAITDKKKFNETKFLKRY